MVPQCYRCVKYSFICITFVFIAISLLLVVASVWMLTDQTLLLSLAQEQENLTVGLYIHLGIGIFMMIIAFLGCCGAFRSSKRMLIAFFSCLLVMMVAEYSAGAWLYINGDSLKERIESSLMSTVKHKYGEDNSHTQVMDAFQSGLGCCGTTGPADWAGSKYAIKNPSIPVSLTVSGYVNNVYKVPESCCKHKEDIACKMTRNIKVAGVVSPAIYSEGCAEKLMDFLHSQKSIGLGIALAAASIVQLLGLIFSLVLWFGIGSSDRYEA